MDPFLLLLFILFLFILVFGAANLLRREALSARLALEVLALGGMILLVSWLLHWSPPPLLFLVVIYLVAMRARLLVDLANLLARRGRLEAALRVYSWAGRLATNATDQRTLLANQGAALLLHARVPEAVAVLHEALAPGPGLGIRQEAACRCNLGLAHLRQKQADQARAQFEETVALLPGSAYARRALREIEKLDKGSPA